MLGLEGKARLAKFGEWLGRDPHPSAGGRDIYHIKAPLIPQYRFEWHPKSRKIYIIRIGTTPEIAEALAFNIETHGDALNAVLIWSRGFREGQTPTLVKTHLQD